MSCFSQILQMIGIQQILGIRGEVSIQHRPALRGKAIACLAFPLLMGTAVFAAPSSVQAQTRQGQTSTTTQKIPKATRVRWKPKPERGNARGTLSGGRRGSDTVACGNTEDTGAETSLRLLVPQGQGKASLLTTLPRPTLAWQVQTEQPVEMELIVSDVQQPNPLWVQRFETSRNKTFSSQLPPAATLRPNGQYRWSVVVYCPSGQKSEIYARSFIRFASRESLEEQRSPISSSEQLSPEKATMEQALAYAEQGIWYDAAASLLGLPNQVVAGQPADLLAELLGQAEGAAP